MRQFQGVLYLPPGGRGRLLYIGAQYLLNSAALIESQAKWSVKYMAGDLRVPSREEMEQNCAHWTNKCFS